MNKIVLIFLILATSLFAELKQGWATESYLNKNKNVKIIDIRTPAEWRETGIVKGAYPIMFFDEKGQYDVQKFLKELNKVVKKGEQFALICHTGSRTTEVSKFLANEFGYNVINLNGGMMKLMQEGYRPVKYLKGISNK